MMRSAGRGRELVRIARTGGPAAVTRRLVRRAGLALGTASLEFPLQPGDVTDAERAQAWVPAERSTPSESGATVAWVMAPPGPGSGGHTTIFRMIAALEAAGHRCLIALYDRWGGQVSRHERTIRDHWPQVRARVLSLSDLVAGGGATVSVATSWPTAHAIVAREVPSRARAYFVQDFEPWFHPKGAEQALAEDTYRFGFTLLALGETVATALRGLGLEPTLVTFGCDSSTYTLTNPTGPREGVSFYARRTVARRGYELGVLALARLHELRPDVPIHTYGEARLTLPFPQVEHGLLSPAELADLHNATVAGLALSFTNISLLPDEMLAAGARPVVNDCAESRAGLPHQRVAFAPPTPTGLAAALIEQVDHPADPTTLAASARGEGWAPAARIVTAQIERLAGVRT